jgi:hypothetical protein
LIVQLGCNPVEPQALLAQRSHFRDRLRLALEVTKWFTATVSHQQFRDSIHLRHAVRCVATRPRSGVSSDLNHRLYLNNGVNLTDTLLHRDP